MTTSHVTDRDIEAVFAGSTVHEPELVELQEMFASMKTRLVIAPTTHHVTAFAGVLAQAALDAPGAEQKRAPGSLLRKLVLIGVGVGVSAFGVAGAAMANEAAPGDLLYGVDTALESVGILNGGTGERFHEAEVLVGRGDLDGATSLTVKTLDQDGQHDAAVDLEQAVAGVESESSGDDARSQVSDMLAWMSQQELDANFGSKVSEHAKELAAANAHAEANPPTDPGSQAHQPVQAGSQANPPVEAGSQAHQPVEAGRQANQPTDLDGSARQPADSDDKADQPADSDDKADQPADSDGKANQHADPDRKAKQQSSANNKKP
jgi:hypothetical protein